MAISNPGSSTQVSVASGGGGSYKSAFAMVTTLFFIWGFLTSLNDILIPHFKDIFGLSYAQVTRFKWLSSLHTPFLDFPQGR